MPNSTAIQRFRHRLIELGYPESRLRRDTQELADHYEDLKNAATAEGLTEAVAEAKADQLLGDPIVLAERAAERLRRSYWSGRHPFIAFCLLPPFAYMGIMIATLLSGVLVISMFLGIKPADLPVSYAIALSNVLFYAVPAMTAGFLGWLVMRSASGTKWMLVGCMVCAAYNRCFFLNTSPENVNISFGIPQSLDTLIPTSMGNIVTTVIPLSMGMWALFMQRRRERLSKTNSIYVN